MSDFILGLLSVTVFFAFSFGIMFIVKFILLYIKFKKTQKNEPTQQDPKVYYITNVIKQRPPKRKIKPKPTNIALKGSIISPENFKKVYREDDN